MGPIKKIELIRSLMQESYSGHLIAIFLTDIPDTRIVKNSLTCCFKNMKLSEVSPQN